MKMCHADVSGRRVLWVALVMAALAPPAVGPRLPAAQTLFHPWPMFHRDHRHTGRTSIVGPQSAAVRWQAPVGAIGQSSPAVARDGTIYIGSYGAASSGIVAVNLDGAVEWIFPVQAGIMSSSPALAPDGTIYAGTNAGTVTAVNPDGTQKWIFAFLFAVTSSPTVGPDGTIYVGDAGGCIFGVCLPSYLYAFNPDGTVKWRYLMSSVVGSSAAVGPDGTIYVSDGAALLALTPGGALLWRVGTAGTVSTAPAVGWRGTVYVGTSNGYVEAIGPNGRRLWSRLVMDCNSFFCGVTGSPAIARDGSVVVGDALGYVTALSVRGAIRWQQLTGDCRPFGPPFPMTRICSVDTSPAIGGDGTIYVGTNALDTSAAPVLHAYLNAFSAEGVLKWRYETGVCDLACGIRSSPAIGHDGTVFTGTEDGHLYAFGPG